MAKSTCVFSEPVRVSLDEIMTEFLRRIPEPELVAAIRSAAVHSQDRLKQRQPKGNRRARDDSNKAQVFFRHMVERLPSVPDDLVSVLGIKSKTIDELQAPDMAAEPQVSATEEPSCLNTELPVASLALPPEAIAQRDIFKSVFDIPSFDEYKGVFQAYPYAAWFESPDLGSVIVLGYASGRKKDSDDLVRRNCAVSLRVQRETDGPTEREERSFNDLVSMVGNLVHKEGGLHRFIKVIRYQAGTGIRFWTNLGGKGDVPDLARYIVVTKKGLVACPNRASYDKMLAQFDRG